MGRMAKFTRPWAKSTAIKRDPTRDACLDYRALMSAETCLQRDCKRCWPGELERQLDQLDTPHAPAASSSPGTQPEMPEEPPTCTRSPQ